MIRYNYNQQRSPPAPFLHVRLQNPITGSVLESVPAQLDCAADRTLIPETLVQKLDLPQLGTMRIGGVGGVEQVMATYPLVLAIHDAPPQTLEVVASPGEGWVLLGRDVMNAYRMKRDGPQLTLEVDQPNAANS